MADHGARAHAEYAPSAAYRWMRCKGSIRLSRGVPAGRSSIYAEEGTQCHEAADKLLTHTHTFAEATRDLSDEQKLIVEEYVDFCNSKWDDASADGDDYEVYTEARMHAPGISPKFFGTGDFAIVNYTTRNLRFIDLKAGAVPVYVRDKAGKINPQLGSYLLLMLARLGASVSRWDFDPKAIGIETMTITIVQPKVYDCPQSTRVEIAELQEFLDELCEAIDDIEAGVDELRAGEWCKFCPAKGACPELRKEALRKAQMDFAPETLHPFHEWAAILAEAELIAAHVQGIRAKIRAALEQGHDVPGFKLVTKRQRQEWLDFDTTVSALKRSGAVFDLYKSAPMTPAAIKKAAKVAKFKFDFDAHIVKKPGGLTIVPENDPRPGIKIEPGADFAIDDDEGQD
jgi:hypothetical protein